MMSPGVVVNRYIDVALIRIMAEPRAWTKKYFKAASDEYELNLDEMMGMKERRFSSSPSQLVNHELAEVAMTIPKISDLEKTMRLGVEFRIKKRRITS